MNMIKVGIISLLLIVFIGSHAYCADVAKVGILDLPRILNTSSIGKSSQAEVDKSRKRMDNDLQQRRNEIEGLQKQLEKDAYVVSEEVRNEKDREIRIRINDFKETKKKYTNEARELSNKLLGRIRQEITEICDDIGKKEGYLLIIEKHDAGVIYSPTSIDISDQVIQTMNLRFADDSNNKVD
jgi:outer membrane protein